MAQEKPAEECTPDVGVIPYILSPDATKHMEWLKIVFDGKEQHVYRDEDTDKVLHAGIKVNGSAVYFSDGACVPEQQESVLPAGSDVRGIVSHLNVEDPHPMWKRALENGATVVVPLKQQFWGDMYGSFRDPYGYEWSVCAQVKTEEKKGPEEADKKPKELEAQ